MYTIYRIIGNEKVKQFKVEAQDVDFMLEYLKKKYPHNYYEAEENEEI